MTKPEYRFLSLFGVRPERIKPLCVLLPFAPRRLLGELGVSRLSRGKLYGSGEAEGFTVIRTGMGPLRVGDAVLELAETPARRLILFGSCGSLASPEKDPAGELVTPARAFAAESFTDLLLGGGEVRRSFHPDPVFQQSLLAAAPGIREVTLLSAGSLKLEKEKKPAWIKAGIETVDLESAAFFAAARARGRAAVSLLLISDTVGGEPFYRNLSPRDRERMNRALQKGSGIICRLSGKLKD